MAPDTVAPDSHTGVKKTFPEQLPVVRRGSERRRNETLSAVWLSLRHQVQREDSPRTIRDEYRPGPDKNGVAALNDVLKLPETLDTAGALSLLDDLLVLRGTATRIDASAVTRMNGFAAEILVAARRQWVEDEAELSVVDGSDAFRTTLADLGLTDVVLNGTANPTEGAVA